MSDKTTMHGSGESCSGVVLVKQPNKSGRPQAGAAEGRPLAKENTPEPNPYRTPCRICGSHGLGRVCSGECLLGRQSSVSEAGSVCVSGANTVLCVPGPALRVGPARASAAVQ